MESPAGRPLSDARAQTLAVTGVRALTPIGWIPDATIVAEAGRVKSIEAGGRPLRWQSATVIDGSGHLLVPGFIDLQLNGALGHDVTTDPASIWEIGSQLPRFGVTAFLPTVVSSPQEAIEAALDVVRAGPPPNYHGARVIGLHLEGPFLNPESPGVHERSCLRAPDPIFAEGWSRQAGIALVTLAPELPGALDLVPELVSRGVIVSAGHSAATYDEGLAAIDAGVTYATHLFNQGPPLRHREPGLTAAVLLDGRVTIGLVADGIHVHPAIVELVRRIVGRDRLSLVSDGIEALGMPPGRYRVGAAEIDADGGSARRGDGRLAGSVQALDRIVRNVASTAEDGAALSDILAAVTSVPARLLGLDHEVGVIMPGAAADFVLLAPSLEVVGAFVAGVPLVGPARGAAPGQAARPAGRGARR